MVSRSASPATLGLLVIALLAAALALWFVATTEPAVAATSQPPDAHAPALAESRAATGAADEDADQAALEARQLLAPQPSARIETTLVRGKLVVLETGKPPTNAEVAVYTGQDELDYATEIAALGGKDAFARMQRSGELELRWRAREVRRPSFHTEAAADGSFAVRVPTRAIRFRFEVEADLAIDAAPQWLTLGSDEVAQGVIVYLRATSAIEGTLVKATGQPATGGLVSLALPQHHRGLSSPRILAAAADDQGRFVLRTVPLDSGSLLAVADGCGTKTEQLPRLTAGEAMQLEIRLPDTVPLEGLALDGQGQGIPGIVIRLRRPFGPFDGYGVARSDADGCLRWQHLLAGEHEATVFADGFYSQQGPVQLSLPLAEGADRPRWVFDSGHFVAGQVLDNEGRGAPAVLVHASTYEAGAVAHEEHTSEQEGRTDAAGRFRLTGLRQGSLTLRATLEDVATTRQTGVPLDTDKVEIRLPATTGIRGVVLDDASGSPVRAFEVSWGRKGGKLEQRACSNELGTFDLLGLAADTYEINVTAGGWAAGETDGVIVKAGEVTRAPAVRLTRAGMVTGQILDDATGEPLPGASVGAVDAEEKHAWPRMLRDNTDPAGRFEVRAPTSGRFRIWASHPARTAAKSEVLDVLAGQRLEIPALRLSRGGTIVGQAFGLDGKPLQGGNVMAMPQHGFDYRFAKLARDGTLQLEGLELGDWRLLVHPASVDGDWSAADPNASEAKVTLVDATPVHVRLEPQKGSGCTVRGNIWRAGKPVAKVSVRAWGKPSAEGDYYHRWSTADQAGSYTIEDVPPGRAQLVFDSDTKFSTELEVPHAAEHRFDIHLPDGRVEGRILRKADGHPLPGMGVSAKSVSSNQPTASTGAHAATDREGRYAIAGLLPGSVRVHVSGQPQKDLDGVKDAVKLAGQVQTITVTDGSVTTLDFRLDEGATVKVEVLDPDGKLASAAHVQLRSTEAEALALTGGSGAGVVTIEAVPLGRLYALVHTDGYPVAYSKPFEVSNAAPIQVQVRLVRGVEATLRLLGPDGARLQPKSITLRDAHGTVVVHEQSESDTGATVRVAPGAYRATFALPGFADVTLDVTIEARDKQVLDLTATKLEPVK